MLDISANFVYFCGKISQNSKIVEFFSKRSAIQIWMVVHPRFHLPCAQKVSGSPSFPFRAASIPVKISRGLCFICGGDALEIADPEARLNIKYLNYILVVQYIILFDIIS